MAPPKVLAASVNAFGDDLAVIDPPTFARAPKRHSRAADVAVREDGTKRHKSVSSRKPFENKATDAAGGKEKISSLSAKDKVVDVAKGKTRFYHESIRLRQDMVEGQLLGFGRLILAPKHGDYGETRFYAGSSSSGELDSLKEEAYCLARTLGVSSDADMACRFNFREIGLPTGSEAATNASSQSTLLAFSPRRSKGTYSMWTTRNWQKPMTII